MGACCRPTNLTSPRLKRHTNDDEKMSATKKSRPPYKRHQWALHTAFAVIPFVLFLLVVWAFVGADQQLIPAAGVIGTPPPPKMIDYANARVGMAILDYSIHLYIHVLISVAAIFYFVLVICNHARARSFTIWFEIGYAMLLTLVFGVVVIIVTIKDLSLPILWRLYVAPFRDFFELFDLLDKLSGRFLEPSFFFYLSVIVPTLFGIVAVSFCTSAFHHVVCSRRPRGSDDWPGDIVRCVTVLKRQLAFLSLVFVSSVLTSRAYVRLPLSLIDPENKYEYGFYSDLASTLSFSSSMLFTATVLAAFAPGVVLLLRDLTGLSSDEKRGGLTVVLERLKISKPISQIAGIARAVLTLAAPALVGPLVDLLSTTTG